MGVKYRAILTLTVLTLALMVPLTAHGAEKTLAGTLVGVTTVMGGPQYSRDMMLAHATFEPDFVLLVKPPQEHYMLANLPRDIKVRFVGEEVRVTGEVNPQNTAIKVSKLEVKQGDTYTVAWTAQMQWKAYEERQKFPFKASGSD